MIRVSDGCHALLTREQWQLLMDVLDGHYDHRKLERAQDALTCAAPLAWLEDAEADHDARRGMSGNGDDGETS